MRGKIRKSSWHSMPSASTLSSAADRQGEVISRRALVFKKTHDREWEGEASLPGMGPVEVECR